MKVSRRMFMRAAPAAPVVAQQAVKDIATKAALSVVGGASGGVPIGYGGAIAQAGGYESARRGAVSYIGDLIRSGKRPEWRVGTDRLQARRRAIMLDADVEALVSVSSAAKRRMQFEREYDRIIEEEEAHRQHEAGWMGLLKRFGWSD